MENEIEGTLGDDNLVGTDGADRITGHSGNDIIDGRGGNDIAYLYGAHADFIIGQNQDGSWTITDTEQAFDNQGVDQLINIEQISFSRTGDFTPAALLAQQTTEDQVIVGTEYSEMLNGSLGHDRLTDGDGHDFVYGGPGYDTFFAGRGDDFINGGTGFDKVVLTGAIEDYNFVRNPDGGYTLTDNRSGEASLGTDQLYNIEYFEFENSSGLVPAEWMAHLNENGIAMFEDVPEQSQLIIGHDGLDAFVLSGSSTDYGWGQTLDGGGMVVWSGDQFDILYNVELIGFDDGVVLEDAEGNWTLQAGMELGDPLPDPDRLNVINDIANESQFINGGNGLDAFVISGNSTDYGWGQTEDGLGTVVWSGDQFDILNNVEQIGFDDGVVIRDDEGNYSFQPGMEVGGDLPPPDRLNLINDVAGENQFIRGGNGLDAFIISGNSTDHGWGQTTDGLGTVVWSDGQFDILNDVEQIRFDDGVVTQDTSGDYVFTPMDEFVA